MSDMPKELVKKRDELANKYYDESEESDYYSFQDGFNACYEEIMKSVKTTKEKFKKKIMDELREEGETQIEVELFLRTKGRLPTEKGDAITKSLAKEFLDKFHEGKIDKKYTYLTGFAFHVFASTNKDYK